MGDSDPLYVNQQALGILNNRTDDTDVLPKKKKKGIQIREEPETFEFQRDEHEEIPMEMVQSRGNKKKKKKKKSKPRYETENVTESDDFDQGFRNEEQSHFNNGYDQNETCPCGNNRGSYNTQMSFQNDQEFPDPGVSNVADIEDQDEDVWYREFEPVAEGQGQPEILDDKMQRSNYSKNGEMADFDIEPETAVEITNEQITNEEMNEDEYNDHKAQKKKTDTNDTETGKLKKIRLCVTAPFALSLTIVLGALRALIFMAAATPCIETALSWMDGNYVPDTKTIFASYNGLFSFWSYLLAFFERVVCILIMADVKLSTDAPFGNLMKDYTFLYLFKIPPMLSRGLMLVILAAIPPPPILTKASKSSTLRLEMAMLSFVTSSTKNMCIIPGVILIIWSLIRNNKSLLTTNIRREQDNHRDHWLMKRYYQRDSYIIKDQIKRQRAEKILLLFVVIVTMATNITNFVFKLKARKELILDSSVEQLASNFISNETLSTIRQITGYLNFIAESTSPLLVSIVLAIYFFALLIRKAFVPVHTVAKILLVYIAIKSVPSSTFLDNINIRAFGDDIGVPLDYFMWIFACIPFVIFLPMLLYVCTRSPKDVIQEVLGILRSFLELLLNFVFPSKVYRLLSTISSVLGACSFVLVIFSVAVPWNNVVFRPNKDLEPATIKIKGFLVEVNDFIKTFEQVSDSVCGESTKEMESDINNSEAEINKKDSYGDDDSNIGKVKDNFTLVKNKLKELKSPSSSSESCRNLKIIDDVSCAVYMAAYFAAIALMLVPFAGIAGKIALQAARVSRTVLVLLKRFINMKGKIDKVIELLKLFRDKFLTGIIHTWTVTFLPEKYMMIFLFPCIGLGLFCISLGFWHRSKFSDARIRAIISVISTVFLFTNGALCAFTWLSKWVTEEALKDLPLVDVEVQELVGWKMIKLAYIMSTVSALVLWLFSSADLVIAVLKSMLESIVKLCQGKICRKKKQIRSDPRKSTMKKIISYTKKEKMKAKEMRKQMEYDDERSGNDGYSRKDRKKAKGKLSLMESNMLLTRVWAMPLFPAVACGLLLGYVCFAGNPAFVGEISLKERTVESITSIESEIKSTVQDITILSDRDKCDPITFLVEIVFKAVTDKLTSAFLENFKDVSRAIKEAFSNIPKLKLDNLNILFVLLPLLASLMFVVGFVVTLIPMPQGRKIQTLMVIERYILMFVSSAITFYMTTTESLFALVSGVPLMNINIKNGSLVQFGQLASFLLLLAFFELKISQLVPISR